MSELLAIFKCRPMLESLEVIQSCRSFQVVRECSRPICSVKMKTDLFIYQVEIADTESSSSLEIRMLLCNELMTPDALSCCSNHIIASRRGPLQLYGSGSMPLLSQSNQQNEHRFPSKCIPVMPPTL